VRAGEWKADVDNVRRGCSPRRQESKYNENRAFRYKTAAAPWQNQFSFNHLHGKFVARRINRISPPINELKPPYQPNYNGKYAGCENRECDLTVGAPYPSSCRQRPISKADIDLGRRPHRWTRLMGDDALQAPGPPVRTADVQLAELEGKPTLEARHSSHVLSPRRATYFLIRRATDGRA
jgi:hypothetical protein